MSDEDLAAIRREEQPPHVFLNVPLPDGALIIKRTSNGWILGSVNAEEGIVSESVYQDPENTEPHRLARAISFAAMLFDNDLIDVWQTKWAGGLVMRFEPNGREVE